jgi:uncharacterized protein YndB with AHSA1/START domain
VPIDRLFDAFVDHVLREQWLPDGELRERTASKPKSARFDWSNGTRVIVDFKAKGESKSVVALAHERLSDAAEAERMKALWRERLNLMRSQLERGEQDA